MHKFLSLYHPRLVHSLVYLLQGSEYYVGDFLRSLVRAKQFDKTEHRGKLDFTPKATLLYAIAYFVQIGLLIGATYFGATGSTLLAVALFVSMPVVIVGTLMACLALIAIPERLILKKRIREASAIMQNHQGTVIAIAGSYGKTTTRNIITTILGGELTVATPIKNHNTPLAIASFIKTLTGKEDVVVVECGEYYPGDVRQIVQMVQPDIGIICGVNEAHLARFGTLASTTSTIFELADELAGGEVYVNADDTRVAAFASPQHIRYGNGGLGDTKCTLVRSDLSGQHITLTNGATTHDFTTTCIGPHVIGSIVLGIHLARSRGLSDTAIQKSLDSLQNPPHRFELRTLPGDIQLLDDSYNGNPDGVRVMLAFLATLTDQRIVYITPGLVELGAATVAVHTAIADQIIESHIDHVILIDTSATAIIRSQLEAKQYQGLVTIVADMPTILAKLDTITVPGDLVVLQNDWGDNYV
jgi:UDP-N-acetylmuramoyl-tripeptide--D-alanyl-D-alanine ligase